jgi:hypothetical protein
MTQRTAILTELFTRCATIRPDVEWIPGFPGDDPPRRRVHVWEFEGDMEAPASPDVYYDNPTLTVHFEDDTGGMSRAEAMQRVEDLVTVMCDVIRLDPTLGGNAETSQVRPGLATYIGMIRGPYSEPNPVEAGFSGRMSADVTFNDSVATPTNYSPGQP